MRKEPIFFDENRQKAELSMLEFGKETLQNLVNDFSKIDSLEPLQGDDFKEIYLNPEKYVSQKLVEKHNISVGGLPIKLNKVFDLVDKPSGFDEFIEKQNEAFAQMSGYAANNGVRYNLRIDLSEFEFNDGKIEIKSDSLERIKQSCSQYITNETQQFVFDKLTAIEKNINDLRDMNKGHLDILKLIKEGLGVDLNNQLNHSVMKCAVQPAYVLKFKD